MSPRIPSLALALAMVILNGCSEPLSDPAFLEITIARAEDRCDPDRLCVAVEATVDGSRAGDGSCELYGPGDPEHMEPLASSGNLDMRPGETVTWQAEVSSDLTLYDLNPVCRPMAEG